MATLLVTHVSNNNKIKIYKETKCCPSTEDVTIGHPMSPLIPILDLHILTVYVVKSHLDFYIQIVEELEELVLDISYCE